MKIENKMKQSEIKFRAWDGEKMWEIDGNSKVVLEFNKISGWNILPNKPNYQGEYLAGESATNKEFHLMQFTGLKDKNGVEVYEGDICELEIEFQGIYNEFYEQPPFHHILTGIVKYMPSTGYYLSIFKGIDVDTEEDIYHPKRKEIVQYRTKLIGNIHQNKHLLK